MSARRTRHPFRFPLRLQALEGRVSDADALKPADRDRLAAIRAELDPDGVIVASRFLRDRDGKPSTPASR